MTLPSSARLAGTAYLLYFATGIGSMAAPAQIRPLLGTVMAFCALAMAPGMVGEGVLTVWLLAAGVDPERWRAHSTQSNDVTE